MANSMNRVTLIGNLGKDPEIKVIPSGSKVANFTMATTESYKDKSGDWQQTTDWHNVNCWDALADKMAKMSKGAKVLVEGKIKTRSYQDKDGATRYITEILANTIMPIEREERSEGGGYSGGGGNSNYANNDNNSGSSAAPQGNSDINTDFNDMDDDDVPF